MTNADWMLLTYILQRFPQRSLMNLLLAENINNQPNHQEPKLVVVVTVVVVAE